MALLYLMPVIFLIGVICIAFEDQLKVNKAAVSIGMCMLIWILFITHATGVFQVNPPDYMENISQGFPEVASMSMAQRAMYWVQKVMLLDLGDVATTLFFVLTSMAIVEILDAHGSFRVITDAIKTRSKRSLVWVMSGITFLLSALLGNLATVIVIIAVLRKIIPDRNDRLIYSCLTILCANAGGSWSPIGDVTTLLLWTGGNLTAEHQIVSVILPALVMAAIPAAIVTFMFGKGEKVQDAGIGTRDELPHYITPSYQKILLVIGLVTFVAVPIMQSALDVPPFMVVLFGLSVLWTITDIRASNSGDDKAGKLKMSRLFRHLDISTVFFFLGILMSVKALEHVGSLTMLSTGLSSTFSDPNYIALTLGVCSSFLDNVALVAATMGMYPVQAAGEFMMNSSFWTFLAYCAVTGGSILIIGSASGVTVMGLEKIEFGYYLKKMTPLVILGYAAGAVLYLCVLA